MSDGPRETEPARIRQMDVGIEDHGFLFMWADFDFGGSVQGFGYTIDDDFIRGIIEVCNVERLSQCKGCVVQVTHDWGKIYRLDPMKFDKGKAFDIEAWGERARRKAELLKAGGLLP